MPQLNINLTPSFEEKLERFMKIRGIPNKSDAVRIAVQEGLERSLAVQTTCDFRLDRGSRWEPG